MSDSLGNTINLNTNAQMGNTMELIGLNNVVHQLNVGFKSLGNAIIGSIQTLIKYLNMTTKIIADTIGTAASSDISDQMSIVGKMAQKSLDTVTWNLEDELKGVISGGTGATKTVSPNIYGGAFKMREFLLLADAFAPFIDGVKGMLKSLVSGKGGAKIFGSNLKQFVGNPLKTMGAMAQPFKSAMGMMGPQMIAMAIVLEPVMAFLQAILEPFSFLSTYMEAFGTILGQMFLPIIMAIIPVFDAFIPILMAIVPPLADVLLLLFNMSGIGILINILTPFMPLITSFIQIFAGVLGMLTPFLNIFQYTLIPIIEKISIVVTGWVQTLQGLVDWLTRARDAVIGWMSTGGLDKNTATWY